MRKLLVVFGFMSMLLGGAVYAQDNSEDISNEFEISAVGSTLDYQERAILLNHRAVEFLEEVRAALAARNGAGAMRVLDAYILHMEDIEASLKEVMHAPLNSLHLEVFVVDNVKEQRDTLLSLLGDEAMTERLKEVIYKGVEGQNKIINKVPDEVAIKAQEARDQGDEKLKEARERAEEMINKAHEKAKWKAQQEADNMHEIIEEIETWITDD